MELEKTLKALGDSNRLRILNLVMQGELCVCEIEEILGLSQTNVSRHLNRLSVAGALKSRKNAQWVFYRINDDFMSEHPLLVEYLALSFEKIDACRLDTDKLKNKKASGTLMQCWSDTDRKNGKQKERC